MSKILVIDDDQGMRRVARLILTSAHHEVIEADTPAAGLHEARTQQPDLVICDIYLPLGSGWDVLDDLRREPSTSAIPVILVTGSPDASFVRRGMGLGADDFLYKPFTGPDLVAAVEARIRAQHATRARAELANRQLLQLLEATGDIVAIVDPETHGIRHLNAAASRATGIALDREGGPAPLLIDLYAADARRQMLEEVLPTVLSEGTWSGETTLTDRQGKSFPVHQEVRAPKAARGAPEYLSVIARDTTERHRAEAALRQSEAKFRAIVTTTRSAVIMADPTGAVTLWNPAAERMFGLTDAQALGMDAFQLAAEGESRIASRRAFQELLEGGAGSAPGPTLEVCAHRADGQAFVAEVSMSAVELEGQTHAVGILRDVTELRDATQTLVRERILLRTLIDALPAGIYAKDREARKTLANQADVRSLGKATEAGVLGKTDFELLELESATRCHADDLRVIRDGESVVHRQERIVGLTGQTRWLETTKLPLRDAAGEIVGLVGISLDITARRRAEEQLRKLSLAVEQSPASVVITDRTGRIEYVNAKFCAVTGYEPAEMVGKDPRVLKSGHTSPEDYRELWQCITAGLEWRGEFHNRKKNGELYWEAAVISPIKDEDGQVTHYLAVKEDITARKQAAQERLHMEVQLRQAQKLEAIGQLAAGIAHEINTPMQYVGDNTRFLKDAFHELSRVVIGLRDLVGQWQRTPGMAATLSQVEPVLHSPDIDYLLEEVPQAIEQSLEGTACVAKIVRAMKEFSHPGTGQKTPVDLNHAIQNTVAVARNEWKYVAELETELDPDLPLVPCLPGELNQVLLNLIINAAHAIADARTESSDKGRIVVRTRVDGSCAVVEVRDTGTGIPEAARARVFDPFFTTKPVGKGTGQGLAIAHSVVVDKHGGTLSFDTEVGRGTVFNIRLPLTAPEPVALEA